MKIMIDTGHGRVDENGFYVSCPSPDKNNPRTWYKCCWNGSEWIYEGEWNDIIGTELAWVIQENPDSGIDFEVVTHKAEDMPLNDRIAIFNESDCDLFVSIHFNYFEDSTVKGTEVFVHDNASEDSKAAGQIFAKNLMLDIDEPLRRESNEYRYKTANYKVLRETNGPAVLLELGFFSNPDTQRNMKYQSYREELAESLFKSLKEIKDEFDK